VAVAEPGAASLTVAAVIPVRSLEGSKSRLGGQLDAEEREALVTALLVRTIRAARGAAGITHVVVVSPDPHVLSVAAAEGADALAQSGAGLNGALDDGREWARGRHAPALLVLPADLPFVSTEAIEAVLRRFAAGRAPAEPLVGLVPDRHGDGTNALLLAPPTAIPFSFGGHSRGAHEAAARAAGARLVVADGPLSTDLDTADDLLLVDFDRIAHETLVAAVRPAAPGRAADAETVAGQPRPQPSTGSTAPGSAGRLEVIALDGIPEVRAGDDLPGLVAEAIARTPGALPLQPGDVVVVTQKVVSKAEGAVVDLTTVIPRLEAVEFGRRWDRDPRQVEVVLREARRVIRMARGVIITETSHGFICANGGVDASNVGPASGSVVTLLPVDSDASATRIRAVLRSRFGTDVGVLISDSFGRPWRWGIVDVAIGISGFLALQDLRGIPDADGRVMRSTVRAVADEIASAAELALGKSAGRPAAIVRGAAPPSGEGSIRDALMPPEFDLFA
jgi:coenzyme F420-0:L-glutamate ligase/coenzyme F420-1:gamma-L-glutamate ligase